MTDVRVTRVNGEDVVSLRQLRALLRTAVARAGAVNAHAAAESAGTGEDTRLPQSQAFVTIELEDKRKIVLDAREADAATARIMQRCRIPRSASQGLLP